MQKLIYFLLQYGRTNSTKCTLIDGGINDLSYNAENVSISLLLYSYLGSEHYVFLNFYRTIVPIE